MPVALLGMLSSIIPDVLSRVLPGDDATTKAKKLEIQAELQKAVMDQSTAQMDINKAEATNASVFVSGWRPFAGWCSVVAMMIWPIVNSLLNWILALNKLPPIPAIDTSLYMTILVGMLGLAGVRSFDKYQGIDTKTMKNVTPQDKVYLQDELPWLNEKK